MTGGGGRLARRVAPAVAVIVSVLGMWTAAGPAAAGPFDVLRSLPVPSQLPSAAKPAAPANTPATGGAGAGVANGGAMMVRDPTPQPPLHGLGTDAVAVVEQATAGAPVQVMDYVFAKQTFKIPPKGRVMLSYLTGCLTETFNGGTVTVGLKGSTVAGGTKADANRPGCKAPTPVVLASASEAGATVNRITPFTGANWNERAVRSGLPVFKWEKAAGATAVRIKDMDKPGEPVVWQAAVAKDWIAYPANAAKLAPGMPYKAEAVSGDTVVAAALFSIDPALDVNDTMASRLVPLAPPAA